jgi:hypothetical protein
MEYKYTIRGGTVPVEVSQALRDFIEKFDLEYADNTRFSPVDDPQGMMEFDEISAGGCCGNFEREIEVNGQKWMVGCNYGH